VGVVVVTCGSLGCVVETAGPAAVNQWNGVGESVLTRQGYRSP
jgi:hypothetical protein